MLSHVNDLTQILEHVGRGDSAAADALLPLVYDELRQLPAHWMIDTDSSHSADNL